MLKKILKITLSTFFILLILTAIILFLGLKMVKTSEVEKKLVFKPSKQTSELIPEIAPKTEEKSFLSENGINLTYLMVKGEKKSPVIVFCHGNEANASRKDNQNKIKFLVKNGYEVFALDYRGFGKSSGTPDEKGLYADLDSFISYLKKEYQIPASDIVLWGHSLGSGVVIEEASKKNFKGIIVEGAFTSIEDMKNYRIKNERNFDPASLFIRDYIYNSIKVTQKFSSKDKIALIKSPMLIIHAIQDEQVPYIMGKRLSELKPDAQTYFSETGSHCDYGWQDKPILEFLKELN